VYANGMDEQAVHALEAEIAEICGQLKTIHAQLTAKVACLHQGIRRACRLPAMC